MDYPNLPRAMDLLKGQPQGTEVEARADAEGAKDAKEVEMRELRHKERPQLARTKRLYPQFQLREATVTGTPTVPVMLCLLYNCFMPLVGLRYSTLMSPPKFKLLFYPATVIESAAINDNHDKTLPIPTQTSGTRL